MGLQRVMLLDAAQPQQQNKGNRRTSEYLEKARLGLAAQGFAQMLQEAAAHPLSPAAANMVRGGAEQQLVALRLIQQQCPEVRFVVG